MTDNRTTELREKLTERGVKHEDSELTNFHDGTTTYYTEWGGNDDGDGANVYVEYVDGTVLRMFDATPEQAIAATLRCGMCHITASSTDGLCSDNPRQYFELSCGHTFTLDGLEPPNYCPNCGAKVIQGVDNAD